MASALEEVEEGEEGEEAGEARLLVGDGVRQFVRWSTSGEEEEEFDRREGLGEALLFPQQPSACVSRLPPTTSHYPLGEALASRAFSKAAWISPTSSRKQQARVDRRHSSHLHLPTLSSASTMGKSQSKLSPEDLTDLQKNTYCESRHDLPFKSRTGRPHPAWR